MLRLDMSTLYVRLAIMRLENDQTLPTLLRNLKFSNGLIFSTNNERPTSTNHVAPKPLSV